MAILRAVYGADRQLSFIPFSYTPRPVVAGAELEEDFAIYAALASKCFSMPPTSTMLLFEGDLGLLLFLRRAETPESWRTFKSAFLLRFPYFDWRLTTLSCAISKLVVPHKNGRSRNPTFPHVLFGGVLLAMLPKTVCLRVEAPISGDNIQRRCDFELRTANHRRSLRYEIFGMLSRDNGFVTKHGYDYSKRQAARLAWYAAAGLPPPFIVYADDLWCVSRLRTMMEEARQQLD